MPHSWSITDFFNPSTFQSFNFSILQLFNPSTLQSFNFSILLLFSFQEHIHYLVGVGHGDLSVIVYVGGILVEIVVYKL